MPEPLKQASPIESDSPAARSSAPSPLINAFASGLYSGYAPFASGTFGSLVGVAIYLIPSFEQPEIIFGVSVAVFLLGGLAAGAMERVYGHDPSVVTIDEVLGMWISLMLLPKSVPVIAGGFVLFRLFDILKPWPARVFDRMKGGWSIMLDDVVAGIYANLLLQLAVRLL